MLRKLNDFEIAKDNATKEYQLRYEKFFKEFIDITACLVVEGDLHGLIFFEETLNAVISDAKRRLKQ